MYLKTFQMTVYMTDEKAFISFHESYLDFEVNTGNNVKQINLAQGPLKGELSIFI